MTEFFTDKLMAIAFAQQRYHYSQAQHLVRFLNFSPQITCIYLQQELRYSISLLAAASIIPEMLRTTLTVIKWTEIEFQSNVFCAAGGGRCQDLLT
jgi:hypothetical protein